MITAEQLAQLPDDGLRYELIEGELTVMYLVGEKQSTLLTL